MGVIDWLILLILLAFTIWGIRRGFVAMLVQLAGVVLTFFLISHYYPLVANQLMAKYSLSKVLASIASIVLIMVLIVVITKIVIWGMNRFLKLIRLSGLNRSIGAVIGFANGLLLVIILTVVLDYMPRLSNPLKDGGKHRVYTGVEQLKEDLFNKLKLTNKTKLIQMPKILKKQEQSID